MVRRQWLTADPCARIVGLRTAASTERAAKCGDHFSPSSPLRRNRSVREGEAVDNAFPTRQACASDPLHALLIAIRNQGEGGLGDVTDVHFQRPVQLFEVVFSCLP